MAIEYQVFTDVSGVTFGGVEIHGVAGISIARRRKETHAVGDGEIHESVARAAGAALTGKIELLDLARARSLDDSAGTLNFTWCDARGQTDKAVAITGVCITGVELSAAGETSSKATITFVAESGDGLTDPLTVS